MSTRQLIKNYFERNVCMNDELCRRIVCSVPASSSVLYCALSLSCTHRWIGEKLRTGSIANDTTHVRKVTTKLQVLVRTTRNIKFSAGNKLNAFSWKWNSMKFLTVQTTTTKKYDICYREGTRRSRCSKELSQMCLSFVWNITWNCSCVYVEESILRRRKHCERSLWNDWHWI